MKKYSKKSSLLFAAVMAFAMLALPTMASATGWETDGTGPRAHSLTSSNLSFNVPSIDSGSICTRSEFQVDYVSTAVLTVTSATFDGCTGTGGNGTGCNVTAKATNLDWTATAPTPSTVQVHGVDVDVTYAAAGTCAFAGQSVRVTGTLTSGVFNNPLHEVVFTNAAGLTAHTALGSFAMTVSGTFRDDQQSLTAVA